MKAVGLQIYRDYGQDMSGEYIPSSTWSGKVAVTESKDSTMQVFLKVKVYPYKGKPHAFSSGLELGFTSRTYVALKDGKWEPCCTSYDAWTLLEQMRLGTYLVASYELNWKTKEWEKRFRQMDNHASWRASGSIKDELRHIPLPTTWFKEDEIDG